MAARAYPVCENPNGATMLRTDFTERFRYTMGLVTKKRLRAARRLHQNETPDLRRPTRWTSIPTAVGLIILSACVVGRQHTPDSQLEQRFREHEAAFEELLALVQADKTVEMIGLDQIRHEGETVSTAEVLAAAGKDQVRIATWERCVRLLRMLGVVQVFRGASAVSFKVDDGSILNGDSYKGYEYTSVPPGNVKASLDGYRMDPQDRTQLGTRTAYKALKGKWHLYLAIN